MSLALFMVVLDNLIVTVALPSIREDLGASLEQLEWTVNAYTLAFAVALIPGAALGDRFGRKRTFMAALALFTASSAAAALAPGIGRAHRRPRACRASAARSSPRSPSPCSPTPSRPSAAAPRSACGPASAGLASPSARSSAAPSSTA